ncbi:MAG: sigma-70 family RNA polymerase sigma factor [Xanthomonadaceae bacterium]|nr:sigma-70 family RNA polymerase sigma factor [Xanthomonadaceae bacterium]
MLWERWREGREMDARNALVLRYSPWARMVARDVYMRVHSLGDAWHDCVQNALIGLLESMDRFDPSRGIKFETYARYRVRGAVFNGMRALRESLTKDAYPHDQTSAVLDRIESLGDGAMSDPLDAFVATTVGLGLGFLLDARSFPDREESPSAYAEHEKEELSIAVIEGLEQLDEREQAILTLHYYHHVPFVEIASQLGVTKGRVSQLHKRALERLRAILGNRVHTEY